MKQIPTLFFAILLLWSAPETAQAQEALGPSLDHLVSVLRQGFLSALQVQREAATPKPVRKTDIVAPHPATQTSVVIRKPVPSHQSTAPKPPTSPSYTPPDLSGTVAKVVGALQTMQPTLSEQEIDQAPLGAAQILGANITVEGPSLSERFAGFLRRVVGLERVPSRATADIETSGIPASSILSIPGPAGAGSAINIWHDATSARIGTVRGSESDITINPDGGQVFVAGDLAVSSVLSGMSYEGVIWGRALILNGGELDPNVFVVRATGGKTLFNINTKTEEITINAPVTINAPLQAINITGETQGGGGGGAPTDAGYLLAAADPTLTGERVITAGSNLVLSDTGANGTLTISVAASPTFGGTVSAGSFSGSGTGLTNIPDSAFSGNVALLDRASQTFTGVIRAGSGNIAITTSAGNLAASALGLISGDGTGATSSGSGLEVDTDRLGLVQGCSDGQIVKWVDASNIWQCSADAGAAGASLQGSYDAGNTITTTDNRNIAITLADTTTDSNFTITVASGSTSTVSITRPDAGVGEAAPAQFLLIENLDANVGVAAAVKIQAAAGGITTALDVSDAEIVNAINVGDNVILGTTATIDFTNFDVSGAGAITAASLNAGAGTIQTTGTITGGTVNATTAIQTGGTTRISASGDLVSIGNLTATGAITIASTGAGNDIIINGADILDVQDATTFASTITVNGLATFNTDVDLILAETENLVITNTATGTTAVDLISATLTNNTTSGTQRGQVASIGGSGVTESGLTINYTGTVASGLTAGIIIAGTSTGTIATALDLSDAEIGTGISLAANDITGTTAVIDFTNFDVSSAGTVTIAAGQSYTGAGAVTVSSGGAGALTLDSASNTIILAATDTTLQRTAAGTFTIDLSDAANTDLFVENTGAGAANLRVSGLVSCDTIDTNASGNLVCGTDAGAAGSSLQAAYDAGNTITTSSARDIAITLADTVTDSNFTVTIADASTSTVSISRASGAGLADPAQLLLLDNLDLDRAVADGLKIQAAAGGITDGLDVSDAELVNALNIGSNDILSGGVSISSAELNLLDGHDVALVDTNDAVATAITGTGALGSGSITAGFGAIDVGADAITTTGTITGGTINATTALQTAGTTRIDSSGNLVSIGNISGVGAVTLSSGGAGALTLDSASNTLVIAATDTTLSRTAAGTFTIDLVDAADTTLFLSNSNVGAGIDALLRVDSLISCDTIDTNASGVFACGVDATGGAASLQAAYDGGNTLTTTTARDIAFTLADSAADSVFTITTATGATGQTRLILADGLGTTPPAELLLIDQQDVNLTVANGITIQAAAGGVITDGVDVSDAEIVNAVNVGDNTILGLAAVIDFTNFDVTGAGAVTAASTVTAPTYTGVGAVTLSSGGAGALTLDSASNTLVIAATDTTLSRTAAGTFTIDLVDAADTTLFLSNSNVGAGIDALLRVDSLISCDTIDTNASGVFTCGTDATGGAASLQAAYDGGNIITTTDARDIDLVLANTTTDSNFDIDIAADSTSTVSISRLDGLDTAFPTQLLLLENLDITGTVANGLLINVAAGGAITDAIDVSDAEIVNAVNVGDNTILGLAAVIDFTNFDVTGAGALTIAGNAAINGGSITSTTTLTLDATSTVIIPAGDTFQTDDVTSGNVAITIDSGTANSITLGSADVLNLSGNISQTGATSISTGTSGLIVNGLATFNTDVDLTLAETENLVITNTVTGTNAVDLISGTLTNNTTSGAQNAQLVSIGGSGTTESAMTVNYTGTVAAGLTAGILIQGTSTGTIATALDVSDVEVNTAISVGDNPIQGGALAMQGSTTAALTAQSGNVTITSTGAGNDIVLTPVDRVDITGGGILQVSTITSTGALAISSGGTNTDVTINAIGTGNVLIGNSVLGGLVRIGDATNNVTFAATSRKLSYNGTARQSRKIILTPEFPGAVLTGDGAANTGTMTSDFCSNGNTNPPNTNITVCNTAGDLHNYYNWTSTGANDYDVWVYWQVPSDFDEFDGTTAIKFQSKKSAAGDAVTLTVYTDADTICGTATSLATTGAWANTNYADPTGCDVVSGGSIGPGDLIPIRVQLAVAASGNTVQIGEIEINYLSKF